MFRIPDDVVTEASDLRYPVFTDRSGLVWVLFPDTEAAVFFVRDRDLESRAQFTGFPLTFTEPVAVTFSVAPRN